MGVSAAPSTPVRVLVVDDERNIRTTLRVCLEADGCEVVEAPSAEGALDAVAARPPELAFVDLRLGTQSGLDLLPRLLAEAPALEVVLITAYASFDAAMQAGHRGAREFLPKPFTPAQVRQVLERFRERRALLRRVRTLEGRLEEVDAGVVLESASPRMQRTLALLDRAAASEAPVLLRGESGTGKGALARALHLRSPRAAGPFVAVSCPTLTEQLLAGELFGHVRGALTGAVRDQPGRVEQAEGGTLFLDEVAELGPGLQAQLLRFLHDGAFERLGEGRARRADARVVAATARDLEQEVRAGRFREDLFYRLDVVELALPPLRERPEDVLPLAQRLLAALSRAARRRPPTLAPATEALLAAYPWPGNVRELRNALERALIVWPGEVLEPAALPDRIAAAAPQGAPEPRGPAPYVGGPFTLEQLERAHVEAVVAAVPSLEAAARTLGIDASTLYRKRKRYGGGA